MGKFITCLLINDRGEGVITDTFSYRTDSVIEHVEYDQDGLQGNWRFSDRDKAIGLIKDNLHKGLISYVYITDSYISPRSLQDHFNKYVTDNMMATNFTSEIFNINCLGFSDLDEEIWGDIKVWV